MINKNYSISILFLIVANILPIVGALFFNWDIFEIIFIYWCESGIIGFFNILKILIKARPILLGLFLSIFFTIHFGGFMFVHLMFIIALFSKEQNIFISINMDYIYQFIYPLSALFISHLISFIYNFIGKKEYELDIDSLDSDMLPPYKRIIIMQFVLILGGMLITLFNNKIIGLVLLIVIKTFVDIISHVKSHEMKKS
jgi:hypothetical protein